MSSPPKHRASSHHSCSHFGGRRFQTIGGRYVEVKPAIPAEVLSGPVEEAVGVPFKEAVGIPVPLGMKPSSPKKASKEEGTFEDNPERALSIETSAGAEVMPTLMGCNVSDSGRFAHGIALGSLRPEPHAVTRVVAGSAVDKSYQGAPCRLAPVAVGLAPSLPNPAVMQGYAVAMKPAVECGPAYLNPHQGYFASYYPAMRCSASSTPMKIS